jgi:tetratricopeptide (TPR) repeat protein
VRRVSSLSVIVAFIAGTAGVNAQGQDTPYARGVKYAKSRDFARAAVAFEEGVAAGDARSMDYLGYLYLEGLGTKRNPQTALGYFRRAAELGNDQACRNLGNMYFFGRDIDCDPELARRWWQKSTELGHDPRSAFSLAQLLYLGDGVAADTELAAKYWKLARKLAADDPAYAFMADDATVALAMVDATRQAHPVAGDDLKALAKRGHVTAQGTVKFFALADSGTKTFVKDVPFIYQAHNFCGLASSTMLLRRQGMQVSQFDVALKRSHHRWGEGTDWQQLVSVAAKFGQKWRILTYPNTSAGFAKGKEAILGQLSSGSPVMIDILAEASATSAHSILICGHDPKTGEFLARNSALPFPGFQVLTEDRLKTIWRSRGFIPRNPILQRPMIVINRREQ